jgi:hypothetical protein
VHRCINSRRNLIAGFGMVTKYHADAQTVTGRN